MNCTDCNSITKKHGTDRKGNQRFRCLTCGRTSTEPKTKLIGNMYLSEEKALMCLKVQFVEADEIWSFVPMKDRTKVAKDISSDQVGSAYTFTSIDAQSKLIVAWHLGTRTEQNAVNQRF